MRDALPYGGAVVAQAVGTVLGLRQAELDVVEGRIVGAQGCGKLGSPVELERGPFQRHTGVVHLGEGEARVVARVLHREGDGVGVGGVGDDRAVLIVGGRAVGHLVVLVAVVVVGRVGTVADGGLAYEVGGQLTLGVERHVGPGDGPRRVLGTVERGGAARNRGLRHRAVGSCVLAIELHGDGRLAAVGPLLGERDVHRVGVVAHVHHVVHPGAARGDTHVLAAA